MSRAVSSPPMPPVRTPDAHLAMIDVLRGMAALGVTLFHARVAWWVGWREIQTNPGGYSAFDRAVAWLSVPTPFLGSFVMLFFVISGFCVHRPLREGALAAGPYFARRLLRIYPPYLAAAVLSLMASVWLGETLTTGKCVSVLLLAQNYVSGWSMPVSAGQPAGNPALWSIPVEVELYLAYPALRWLVARWSWGLALTVVGGVSALALAGYHAGARMMEGNFAMYWILWCSGAWLRERWAGGVLGAPPAGLAVAAGLSLATALALGLRGVGGLTQLCWGVVYFWILWKVLSASTAGFAGGKRLRALGDWSYSLYLLHFPLLFITGSAWVALAGSKPANFLITLAGCAAILPAVWIFYRAIERPSHRLARRCSGRLAT